MQSVEHFYILSAADGEKERRKLVREENEGDIWQRQVERRWLAGYLAN